MLCGARLWTAVLYVVLILEASQLSVIVGELEADTGL